MLYPRRKIDHEAYAQHVFLHQISSPVFSMATSLKSRSPVGNLLQLNLFKNLQKPEQAFSSIKYVSKHRRYVLVLQEGTVITRKSVILQHLNNTVTSPSCNTCSCYIFPSFSITNCIICFGVLKKSHMRERGVFREFSDAFSCAFREFSGFFPSDTK